MLKVVNQVIEAQDALTQIFSSEELEILYKKVLEKIDRIYPEAQEIRPGITKLEIMQIMAKDYAKNGEPQLALIMIATMGI